MTPATATRDGRALVLRVPLHPPGSAEAEAAQARAFDAEAPLLDRVLAAVAAGAMRVPVAEAMIRGDAALFGEALALLELATVPPVMGPRVEIRVSMEGR